MSRKWALLWLVLYAPALFAQNASQGFQWGPALRQSAMFLGVQHGFRIATEPGTRQELRGPFVRDYGRSLRGLGGWGDGDPFIVNYVGHPFQGAVSGYIQIHNDPQYRTASLANRDLYWTSRLRAMAFAALYSVQFEIGPISEASVGNVGKQPHTAGAVDHVVTPIGGLGIMVAEDALDHYLVRRVENATNIRIFRILARSCLNPNRSFANLLRFRYPWHRDARGGVSEP